jgi:hypothetical protein
MIVQCFEDGTKSFVVCPKCGVLYQMPVTDMTGVHGRVALDTIEMHSAAYEDHEPQICILDNEEAKIRRSMDMATRITEEVCARKNYDLGFWAQASNSPV